MTITQIILAAVAAIAAIIGAFFGKAIGNKQGKAEGTKEAEQAQKVQQAEAITTAIKERAHVETQVAADTSDDLDRRLSKYDRAD
jgi:flagellar basal body-associated protein FliL